uniref:Retinol dehydrogenase 13 n=1 Tax=Strigamia maritima TaxID=126957 RepID=T1IX52_STRMM
MSVNKLAIAAGVVTAAIFGAIAYKDTLTANYAGTERLDGHTVIITGANSGIGKATTLELAKRGAKIFMACRDLESCELARQEIVHASANERVYCRECNLASLKSINLFAQKIKKEEHAVHILINNAGVMGIPEHTKTKEGLELHFGINYFGHFVLTNLLLDKLKATGPARVITVSCPQHLKGTINFEDLNGEDKYDPDVAYSQSKLACVLFNRELAKKLKDYCVTVNVADPGYTYTEITRHKTYRTNHLLNHFAHPAMLILFRTPVQGAQTILHCALHPELRRTTGKYFDNCVQIEPAAEGIDDEVGAQLWDLSEKLMEPIIPVKKKRLLHGKKLTKQAKPEKTEETEIPEETEKPEKGGKAEKADKGDKPEKPEKPGKGDKPEKPEKPGKGEKPEKPEKPGKGAKPDKAEKAGKNGKQEKPEK